MTVAQPKKIPSKIKQVIDGHDGLEPLTYRSHQIEGIRKLARMNSFLLGDDMGLGKSIQSLTVAALDFDRGWANKILILCPPKLTYNWLEEIEKFTHFNPVVLEGKPVERHSLLDNLPDSVEIVIAGYTMVQKHMDQLNAIGFEICICDEAHELKSPTSKRWKGVRKLKANRWFMLSGTPMLNRPNELWTTLNRIAPETFDNYWVFTHRYCTFGGFKKKQVVGVRRKEELAEILDTVMVRRLKDDVLDLPQKQYTTKIVGLSPLQKKLYKEAIEEFQLTLPGDPTPMELESSVVRFMRLKQICGTPATLGEADESDKLDLAVDIAKELHETKNKLVVFTQFRGVLQAMAERLEAEKIPIYQLHGGVKVADRQQAIKDWTESEEPGVVLAMIQVAGVGLNMVAARHCMFIDKAYVPGVNDQASDRLHRIGASTVHPVEIIELFCKGTVEARVEQILKSKRKMFNDIVNRQALNKIIYQAVMEEELG